MPFIEFADVRTKVANMSILDSCFILATDEIRALMQLEHAVPASLVTSQSEVGYKGFMSIYCEIYRIHEARADQQMCFNFAG